MPDLPEDGLFIIFLLFDYLIIDSFLNHFMLLKSFVGCNGLTISFTLRQEIWRPIKLDLITLFIYYLIRVFFLIKLFIVNLKLSVVVLSHLCFRAILSIRCSSSCSYPFLYIYCFYLQSKMNVMILELSTSLHQWKELKYESCFLILNEILNNFEKFSVFTCILFFCYMINPQSGYLAFCWKTCIFRLSF